MRGQTLQSSRPQDSRFKGVQQQKPTTTDGITVCEWHLIESNMGLGSQIPNLPGLGPTIIGVEATQSEHAEQVTGQVFLRTQLIVNKDFLRSLASLSATIMETRLEEMIEYTEDDMKRVLWDELMRGFSLKEDVRWHHLQSVVLEAFSKDDTLAQAYTGIPEMLEGRQGIESSAHQQSGLQEKGKEREV
ncbi:hypothetical protein TREMEDRAFT_62706 [Tremella mesenterica DSM 1558]|uniref:uncharacterized protein n=1 Tax=Tremella mesenterica (strain ATCC 24925 / CBS 8224 / DSM 1558 / NBRC 9311 / NRRL Y-6157 / RJB 2259-6 / UBC 559-6) TaxID=578456 RepID=UPI0003F4992F|nr:uncharacterized protein TREMEDRAFT_62706 [Tremella mesenterica DSM 1558]EIW68990.1 hypothetical protein TREMEDRAFT_62706 [Tremella mesenterica DSM 1558]